MPKMIRPMAIDIPTIAPVERLNAPCAEPSEPGAMVGCTCDPTPPSGTPTPSCADMVGKAGSVCVDVEAVVEVGCGKANTTVGHSKRHLYK
jgi:hypothetical protein